MMQETAGRKDFGYGIAKCTLCSKRCNNRGCGECDRRFCESCYTKRHLVGGVCGGDQAGAPPVSLGAPSQTQGGYNDGFRSKFPESVQSHAQNPASMSMETDIQKAASTIQNIMSAKLLKDQGIPKAVLKTAKGLAFLTVVRAGFIFVGRAGSGLVISRLPDGTWSAPSAIGTVGMGWGACIGGDLTDVLLVLNTDTAVKAFQDSHQLNLGAEIGVALGPVGRDAVAGLNASTEAIAPVFAYSHSKGAFAGVLLNANEVHTRGRVNEKFYGVRFSPKEILDGTVSRPVAANELYDALAALDNFVPGEEGSQAAGFSDE